MAGWELTKALKDQIYKYAAFKQTSISLRQMVQFGSNPSPGSVFLASQFIVEELPIRLAKKVKDLDNAPLGLSKMPSTIKVKNWYAQSFEELVNLPKPTVSEELAKLLAVNNDNDISTDDKGKIIQDDKTVIDEMKNPGLSESNNPAINNVFSDDGIIIKPQTFRRHTSVSDVLDDYSENDRRISQGSPTFGKKYFNPTNLNTVWPKEVYDYNKLVSDTLSKIKRRHDATVATMAQGVKEWKTDNKSVLVNSLIQTFLDRFYMSRIGIRMLIGQHLALNLAQQKLPKSKFTSFLTGNNKTSKSNYVGVICTDCKVSEIAEDAIETAKYVCEEYYGLYQCPEIKLILTKHEIEFMYVPGHLIHMLFETLKNSLRATIEFHTPLLKRKMIEENPDLNPEFIDLNDLKFPPIKVIISEGSEDIAIKISDEGGGIARSEIPLIWTYLYTTMSETPVLDSEFDQTSFKAPMAGFGYGLPISRLYAQYFGGDLKLISMDGYGTDVYLHLNRLSSSSEPLP